MPTTVTAIIHLMSDDCLDLCESAEPGALTVTPVIADVTCFLCLQHAMIDTDPEPLPQTVREQSWDF